MRKAKQLGEIAFPSRRATIDPAVAMDGRRVLPPILAILRAANLKPERERLGGKASGIA